MYNFAKIYFYGEDIKQNIDESISLLCNSAKKGFQPSEELLCLVLLEKYKSDKVIDLIEKNGENSNENEELASQIDKMIAQNNLKNNDSYNFIYEQCKTIDFFFKHYLSSIALEKNKKENKLRKDQENMMKNITDLFYEGFGIRI
ncbi:hypothetical protein M9Y10_021377 [Tritrichomonas musculus]|uniref:Uncharacterized protein n=1 Tax=Tritrichomonas musculus TaxID=1915356 RepID=A0ABR2HG38_9EUKA